MAIPAVVYQALSENIPGMDEQKAVKLWDDLRRTMPEIEKMDPLDAATSIVRVAKGAGTGGRLKSPYEGTAMQARNPENPQTAHMNQFDPNAIDSATADYMQRYNATVPERNARRIVGAGGTDMGARAAKEAWDEIDANNMLQTLKKQELKQSQATAGIAAGTSLQNQFKTEKEANQTTAKFGEELTQARQKTATGALDLELKKSLYTPGTSAAKLAAVQLRRQYEATGQEFPKEIDPSKMSVEDMKQFMEPKLLASWEAISKGRTAEAGADIDQAVAGAMVNKPKTVTPSGATFEFKPGTDLAVMRHVLATSKDVSPEDLAAFDKKYLGVAGQQPTAPTLTPEGQRRTQFATISGGRQSLPPDPRVMAGATAEGEDAAGAARRARTFDVQVAPALKRLRAKIDETGSGKGTAFLAAWTPGESRELLNLLQNANNVYPGMLPKEIAGEVSKSISQGGFTGALVASLDNGQLKRVIDSMEETALNDRIYQRKINEGQATAARPGQQEVAAPVAPTGIPLTNKQGWKLKTDKNGNRAYVSPDGKQYEEVQ